MNGLKLRQIIASRLLQDGTVFKALISDKYGKGAIANELDAVESFIAYFGYTQTITELQGDPLDLFVKQFTGQVREQFETDEMLRARFLTLTYRAGDTIWGSYWNTLHIFETFIPTADIYILENTDTTNIMPDGDFEGELWVLNNAVYNTSLGNVFSGNRSVSFTANGGTATNTVILTPTEQTTYFMHFFHKGNVSLSLQDDTGLWWDGTTWQAVEHKFDFTQTGSKWATHNIHFFLGTTKTITVKFEGENNSLLDFVQLYLKDASPSFILLVSFSSGVTTDIQTTSMFVDGADPVAGADYTQATYFDEAYISGDIAGNVFLIYNDILQMIKAAGVKATLVVVSRG